MRRAFLAPFLALAAACGGDEATPGLEPPDAAFVRIPLAAAADAPALGEPEVIARFGKEGGRLDQLEIEGEVQHVDGRLDLEPGGTVRIELAGPFDCADLQRVALVMTGGGDPILSAFAFRGDEQVDKARKSFRARRTPGTSQLDFSRVGSKLGECRVDRVVIEIERIKRRLSVHDIALFRVPLPWRLPPGTQEGGALVYVNGESRRGTCLTQERPLEARFRTRGGETLAFSYATPVELGPMPAGATIELSLTHSATTSEHAFEIPVGGVRGWESVRVPLPPELGAADVTARFTFTPGNARPVACVIGEPTLARPEERPATVVLITSDTHRSDHVGGLPGAVDVSTPMLESLAAEGVAFLDAYSSTNNTTPSHVALFTGTHPRDTGVVENGRRLSDDAPTLAERFAEAGYATMASVCAAPVDERLSGLGQGFDRYFAAVGRPYRGSREALADLFDDLPDFDGVPLFVWLHVFDAHAPYEPPEEYGARYWDGARDPRDASRADARPELAPYWDETIIDPEYTQALYRAEVTYVDDGLRTLLERPRFRDAIVAVTADHGEVMAHGDHPFDHRGLNPSNLHVPLILRAPGLPAGRRVDYPVRQIDVGRTLLDLAGLGSAEFPGTDLLSVLDADPASAPPRFALESFGMRASVQKDGWMLQIVLGLRAEEQERRDELMHNVFLYDVRSDPNLERDLKDEHRERALRMRSLLVGWLGDSPGTDWSTDAAFDASQALAALGYTEEESASSDKWFDPECDCRWCREFD